MIVIEACMPEVRPVEVERPLAPRQQVPGVAGQILVHQLLGHHALRLVELRHTVALEPDAAHVPQIGPEIRRTRSRHVSHT